MGRRTRKKTETVQVTLGEVVEVEEKRKSSKKVTSKSKTKISALKKLPGVGAKTAESLVESGYDSVAKIAKTKPKTLSKKVDGVGESTAKDIVDAAMKLKKTKSKSSSRKKTKKKTKKTKTTKKKKSKKIDPSLSKLPGIGTKTAENLTEAGYSSLSDIAKAKPKTLSKEVDGVGASTAKDIIKEAKKLVKKPKPKKKARKKTTKKSAKKKTKTKKSKKKPTSTEGSPLTELPGIGTKTAESMIEAGYDSIAKIAKTRYKTLSKKVDGLGEAGAKKVIKAAKDMMKAEKDEVDEPEAAAETGQPDKIPLTEMPGVGKKTAKHLIEAGYDSISRLSRASPSALAKRVSGLSTSSASKVISAAKKLVKERQIERISRDQEDTDSTVVKSKPKKTKKTRKTKKAKRDDKEESALPKKETKTKKKAKKKTPSKKSRWQRKKKRKPKKTRPEIIRKDSGLSIPKTVEALAEDLRAHWKEVSEQIDSDDSDTPDTVPVVSLSADDTDERLVEVALEVLAETMTTGRPSFEIPSRSRDNIVWDELRDLLLLGMKTKSRPYHSLGSVLDATRTARVMEIVHELLKANLHATKREVFYSDVNLFRAQKYSDRIIEDVASMLQTTRDSIHVVASARGSAMGRVVIRDGGDRIDLTRMGTGGWSITPFLDQVEIIESDAEYIILSEKDAAVMRLAEAKYWNRQPCIILTGKGSGDIATRAFLRKLVKELEIPAFALVDSDPYGHYIYSVFLRGSKRLSYESPFIATPELKLLGVLSRDLDAYNIPKAVRIPMEQTDIKRVKDMLKEPFIKRNKPWVEDLKLMLKIKEKAEIQAFASHSFKFLTDDYLPTKLETGDWI